MIDLYYFPSPNGLKIGIMLEECGLPYEVVPVDIGSGEQFRPEYLVLNPNNKIPTIVDRETGITVFESGAILHYLAEKTGKFIPDSPLGRKEVMEWLFWQVGNQGPMAGQLSHFVNYADGGIDYGKKRYGNEYNRCLGVLEKRLENREYIVGDYSVVDMICWPWVLIAKPLGQSLDDFPNVSRWRNEVKERPAVQRGVNLGKEYRRSGPPSDEERKVMFNQTAQTAQEQSGA